MLLTFFPCGSGGGGASLDITAYASAGSLPTTADENAIALITNTAIVAVTASATAPANPAAGDVYINTDASASYSITIGDDDQAIVIPIKLISQYIAGSWASIVAYARIGGAWVQVSSDFGLDSLSYSGDSAMVDEGGGNWMLKLLTSGTLEVSAPGDIDVFLVGGGGSGGYGGGAGGYTNTQQIALSTGEHAVVVGAGGASFGGNGGASQAFGFTANGGGGGATSVVTESGGVGGCGGGAQFYGSPTIDGGVGGSDGGNGGNSSTRLGGQGQGTTTRRFGEATGTLYAGGGGGQGYGYAGSAASGGDGGGGTGGTYETSGTSGTNNTGGGGGGSKYSSTTTFGVGGSGIVIIRNHRA